jgi:hypothetical protein
MIIDHGYLQRITHDAAFQPFSGAVVVGAIPEEFSMVTIEGQAGAQTEINRKE